jgi:hypothetical protein
MLAMPSQEMRMWTVRHTPRRKRATGFINYRSYPLRIVRLSRDQYLQIVGQANKTTIKHPMRCARKGDPIADDIWPVRFHRPDMCRSDFRPAASIDEL